MQSQVTSAVRLTALAAAFVLWSGIARAQFTFLGPLPYLSAADSPFDLIGPGSTFFLEDFEDLNYTPGVVEFVNGFYVGAGGQGASVDADDGAIDGSGANGYSAGYTQYAETTFSAIHSIEFTFDQNALGYLPTAVGLVLTGGGALTGFSATDGHGNSAGISLSGHNFVNSSTSDDRFVAVLNPDGLSTVSFSALTITIPPFTFNFPRADHLQYGKLVPEPSTSLIVMMGLLAILLFTDCSRNTPIR
jgi:hypothetical protein